MRLLLSRRVALVEHSEAVRDAVAEAGLVGLGAFEQFVHHREDSLCRRA